MDHQLAPVRVWAANAEAAERIAQERMMERGWEWSSDDTVENSFRIKNTERLDPASDTR